MMPGIPDRWEVYSAFGKIVSSTKFIPFKVPLKPSLCKKLPEMEKFTPTHLLNMEVKLGLVIDLTNTRRYYNPEDLISNGISYVKIFCEGRGKIPNLETIRKFYDAVHHFGNENKNGLIGVHCTHGLNRTGYLICRYMIEKLGYSAENAIKEFNEARGHPIERYEYLKDLYKIEERCQNPTSNKNYETRYDETESKCNTHVTKPHYQSRFHSTNVKSNSNGFCDQSYFQNNMHYHISSRYYQRGKNNDWHNYNKQYHHDSHSETTGRFPRRHNYSFHASYRSRSYEGTHNYNRYKHSPQLLHRNKEAELN